MTNDLRLDDADIRDVLARAGSLPASDFVAELRATLLADEAADMIDLTAEPSAAAGPRRRWPVLAAAAAVIAVGIGAIALVTRGDDGDSLPTIDDAPAIGDPIDDPARFLDGGTWVAVGRFDVFPSARTPVFEATREGDGTVRVEGHDGCQPVDLTLIFDGDELQRVGTGESTASRCGDEMATPFVWSPGDRLAESGGDRFVAVRDGEAIIEFARPDDLPAADRDDLVGSWVLDRLVGVDVDDDGFFAEGRVCMPVGGLPWTIESGTLAVDGVTERVELACPWVLDDDVGLTSQSDLVAVLGAAADVRRLGDDIVIVGSDRASRLRPVPVDTPRPDGLDVRDGTAFGIAPGVAIGADDVLAAVRPHLGGPTFDSDWVDAPADFQTRVCGEGLNEYRELHWDDLVFAVWRRGERVSLHYWYVGDRSGFWFDVPDVGAPTSPLDRGLASEVGLGLGDAADDIVGPATMRYAVDDDGRELIIVGSKVGIGQYDLVDGLIVGFGAVNDNC